MNTIISKRKVTIMLDEQVYEALIAKVGGRKVGEYLSQLARPYVLDSEISAGYLAMSKDESYKKEADEWLSGTSEPIIGENNW